MKRSLFDLQGSTCGSHTAAADDDAHGVADDDVDEAADADVDAADDDDEAVDQFDRKSSPCV